MITEIIEANPKVTIVLFAMAITLFVTLITKHFTDQTRIKELKQMQKNCQNKIKEKKGDIQSQAELQKQMLTHSMEMMKHSMKPMLITMIPLLLLFNWIRGMYSQTDIATSWFWFYLVASLVSSPIFRKLLKVE
jgi:uncharacterized membrane protein (DUF106 family)